MSITQIDIKINQTKLLNGGNSKTASQTNDPVNSFDQILAMFNNLGQINNKDKQADTTTFNNVADSLEKSEGEKQPGFANGNSDENVLGDFQKSNSDITIPMSLNDIKSNFTNLNAEALNSVPVGLIDANSSLKKLSAEAINSVPVSLIDIKSSVKNLSAEVSKSVPVNLEPILVSLSEDVHKIAPEFLEDIHSSLVDTDSEPTHNDSESIEDEQSVLLKLSPQDQSVSEKVEDWEGIDAILSALAASIQQIQHSPESLQSAFVTNSSNEEPQTSVDSTILSTLSDDNPRDSNETIQGMEMGRGIDQQKSNETSQWIERVTQIISDLSTNIENKSLKVPDTIEEKIQIIMNELNSKKQQDGMTSSNSSLNKNGVMLNELEQHKGYDSKPILSLDKNQVIFSSLPSTFSRTPEESRLVRNSKSIEMDDLTKFSGQHLGAMYQQQMPGKYIKAGTSSTMPPTLTISEFAPKVNEWISSYIKINDGKTGSTEAKFSLYPEHLGHIEIKINSQQGQISAEILTDTPIAKEVLEGQLQHLRTALQQSGLQVQKLDIVQQSQVSADPNQAGLSFSQDGSQSREQRAFTPSHDGSDKQKDPTEQKEIDRESLAITYGGTVRNKTSQIDFTA